jgi:hypothetical protein
VYLHPLAFQNRVCRNRFVVRRQPTSFLSSHLNSRDILF